MVNYLFGLQNLASTVTGSKRGKSDDGTEAVGHKRARTGDNGKGDISGEYEDVADFLSRVTPQTISLWTHLAAHQYCVDKGLDSYPSLPSEQAWQDGQLDLNIVQDLAIAQRICEFKLREAVMMPIFKDDKQSKIQMYEASIEYIPYWAIADLKELCEVHGLETEQPPTKLIKEVQGLRKAEIHELQQGLLAAGEATQLLKPRVQEPQNKELDQLTLKELKDFCGQQELPEWGSRKALLARAQRWQKEERRLVQGESPLQVNIRYGQPGRTDENGYESYVFRAILGQSSVTALKSALYIIGNFRPDAELKLFFNKNQSDYLTEGTPLSSYENKDWTTLRLKVSTKWRFGPGSLEKNPIDLTGPGEPVFEWPNRPNAPLPEYPSVASAKQIAAGAPMTVAGTVRSINARQVALQRLVREDAGGKPEERTSAKEILEEVEDLEEEEELRAIGPVEPHIDEDPVFPFLEHIERSNASDIYQRIDFPSKFNDGRPEF